MAINPIAPPAGDTCTVVCGLSVSSAPHRKPRLTPKAERTWENRAPLDSDVLDTLIAQCDEGEANQRPWPVGVDHNPFLVFPAVPPTSLASTVNLVLANGGTPTRHADSEDRLLFHHYVDYVASVMMPFEHPWNPWKLYYPSVSLEYSVPGERALYHAILAHAAFNLAHLGGDTAKMMRLAAKHYNASIQHVNDGIQTSADTDSGGILAAIMTLMMAEVYSGQSRKWKHHLQGAWAFLLNSSSNELWNQSRFACFSIQSLLIVRIISSTTSTDSNGSPLTLSPNLPPATNQISPVNPMPADPLSSLLVNAEIEFAATISSTPQFGFTIGAQRSLLECISAIATISQQMRSDPPASTQFDADRAVSQVLACLGLLQAQTNDGPPFQSDIDVHLSTEPNQPASQVQSLARYQLNAFIYATYIYLYRSLMDAPPKRVTTYVTMTFHNISAFCAQSSGNFSLWPAFIAAVEAYTEADMALAREWLERSIHFGLGNRLPVKRIIEEVWRRRDDAHFESTMDKGLITIDWRDVVRDLGVDILLV
ncbi:fungal-specific transcription factor domain-containing protein [Penicillium maclennaniae]|uniref:fungal-specific transcription factor domain-containing protein n=1 Tax=Penicillium maclennaniae TaxID=1343394 RepID=UPI00253F69AF|nr:fungal-specific transcription factor domain-containing protein [Penicillium maclennaniae]KAJ5674350.1 fungal-specific transcription factor domain-containing protein [Penicillium maclennaniae]